MASPGQYDPWDVEIADDPYPHFASLRAQSPVHFVDSRQFWVLSRYDDIVAALKDVDTFSSELVYVGKPIAIPSPEELELGWKPQPEVAEIPENPAPPDTTDEPVALISSLAELDPPEHTRLRSLIARPMSATRMQQLEPDIRAVAEDLFEAMADSVRTNGWADLHSQFAYPLTLRVTGLLMDLPEDQLTRLGRLARESIGHFSLDPAVRRAADEAYIPYAQYFISSYASRVSTSDRSTVGSDLMASLLRENEDGDRLSAPEFAANSATIFRAGFETTTSLVGNGLITLLDHPDQLRALTDDAALVPAAVEEMLRYDGPLLGLFRITRTDAVIGDTTIPAGSFVQLAYAAGNRDGDHYPDAERFDVTRNPRDHLMFGSPGRHTCIGAALARIEARVAFETLLARARNIRLVAPAPILRSVIVRGRTTVPITFDPA